MTVSPTDFGGAWTRTKLDILKNYLDAYTTALKDKPFRLIYVDAFAGSGFWKPRSAGAVEDPTDFLTMWKGSRAMKGSAAIALDIDNKPFDRLVFIEKDDDRCKSLRKLASRRVKIVRDDANKAVPDLCHAMEPLDRAVVFFDPFATEVSWSTVKTLADTKKVDCWILFPLGAIARLMPEDRYPDPESARHLDRVFGERQHWQSLYQSTKQLPLFGEKSMERSGGNEKVLRLYRKLLKSIFEKVAPTQRILRNSKNAPLFALYFSASNKKGASIAVRIADHLLTKW